ncbi:MAG: hypothetical protein E7448_06775 [Ruminococcaceae bacterium]|nr:hypothetical protein [Oscillospiraceae bacterium]
MKKRLFALLMIVVMLLGLAIPAYAENADTTTVTAQTMTEWADAGYPGVTELQIATVSDFKLFMEVLQDQSEPGLKSACELKPGTDSSVFAFVGVTVYLTADLDLNPGWESTMDVSWDHLENDDDFVQDSLDNAADSIAQLPDYTIQVHKGQVADQKGFGGMFDGMGHTIVGLCIVSSNTASAQSLFGVGHSDNDFVVGVKNLSIKNSYIEGTNHGLGALFSGITAGTDAVIENCYVDVDLHSTSTAAAKSNCSAGGLVGQVAGNLTIKDTVYAGEIFGGVLGRDDHRHVGAVTGLVMGGATPDDEAATLNVENFAFTGNINWENSQRVSSLIGRVENYANVHFKNILALGGVLSNYGGLCRNIAGVKEGVTTTFTIENCLYHPNVSQTEVFEKTPEGGTVFAGYRLDANSRKTGYLQLIVNKALQSSIDKIPNVHYTFEAAALGSVSASLKNVVIVDNKDYQGTAAGDALTQHGIAGFQAVEEGYPLPSNLVAVFGTNVAGKSEITNPPEEIPTEPTEPSEPSEPAESVKPSEKPTNPKAPTNNDNTSDAGNEDSNDMTAVIIGIVAAVVVAGAVVVVVIVVKKKAKK